MSLEQKKNNVFKMVKREKKKQNKKTLAFFGQCSSQCFTPNLNYYQL